MNRIIQVHCTQSQKVQFAKYAANVIVKFRRVTVACLQLTEAFWRQNQLRTFSIHNHSSITAVTNWSRFPTVTDICHLLPTQVWMLLDTLVTTPHHVTMTYKLLLLLFLLLSLLTAQYLYRSWKCSAVETWHSDSTTELLHLTNTTEDASWSCALTSPTPRPYDQSESSAARLDLVT